MFTHGKRKAILTEVSLKIWVSLLHCSSRPPSLGLTTLTAILTTHNEARIKILFWEHLIQSYFLKKKKCISLFDAEIPSKDSPKNLNWVFTDFWESFFPYWNQKKYHWVAEKFVWLFPYHLRENLNKLFGQPSIFHTSILFLNIYFIFG